MHHPGLLFNEQVCHSVLRGGTEDGIREVGTMDMEQVIRRWLTGEKIRAIARLTGLDRNTIRRIVRSAEKVSPARGAMARRRQATSDTTGHRPAWSDQRGRGAAKAANRSDSNLAGKRAPVADQSARAIRPPGAAAITVRRCVRSPPPLPKLFNLLPYHQKTPDWGRS
jgi:hypothetical protein